MGKHDHKEEKCEHELKHCTVCDVVYCVKCGKEWEKPKLVSMPSVWIEPYVVGVDYGSSGDWTVMTHGLHMRGLDDGG
jgi:hypothetical protein